MNKIIIANGIFRSGSTFFFDAVRQTDGSCCLYEPFHPRIEQLSTEEHSENLGHSVDKNPWVEYDKLLNLPLNFKHYASNLPSMIISNFASYTPPNIDEDVAAYIEQLFVMQNSLNLYLFACFNRAGFLLKEISARWGQKLVIVQTKRPSLQVAKSLQSIYSKQKPFNLFSNVSRDLWGINCVFELQYKDSKYCKEINFLHPSRFSFLAKIAFINTLINKIALGNSQFIFDLSAPCDHYMSNMRQLFDWIKADQSVTDPVLSYVRYNYRQDQSPSRVSHELFSSSDLCLLEAVGFKEFS
jgi:hypothetical protein